MKKKMMVLALFLILGSFNVFSGGCYSCMWFGETPACVYHNNYDTECFIREFPATGNVWCFERFALCGDDGYELPIP